MSNSTKDRGPFGTFLYTELKQNRKQTAKWLAQELKERSTETVSGSTIRHWLSGSRVPPRDHKAIPVIAEILKRPTKEIQAVIVEALDWQRPKEVADSQKQSASTDLLSKLPEPEGNVSLKDYGEYLGDGAKSIAIFGENEVLETAISRIEKLPKAKPGNQLMIMIQGKMTTIDQLKDELRYRWYSAIRKALEKGWEVFHIIRIDKDLDRIKKMVKPFLILAGHEGNYKPYAFKQKYVLPVAQSFILAPDIGEGMVLYGETQPEHVDAAIYIKDEAQVRILKNHFNLMTAELNPLFSIEKGYNQASPSLLQADENPDNRIAILKKISSIQRPNSFYKNDSAWALAYQDFYELSDEEMQGVLSAKVRRKKNLENCSLDHSCRYIYVGKCVSKFVSSDQGGSLFRYSVSCEDKISQLKHFQSLLNHPYFEMALSEEDMSLSLIDQTRKISSFDVSEIIPDYCEVQKNKLVVMAFSSRESNGSANNSKWIIINEPIIVRAFYEYLTDTWNSINDTRKGKFYVSKWLENEIQQLKVSNPSK